MAIPTYNQFYRAILEKLEDGNIHGSKEIISYCTQAFHISEEDQLLLLESGNQTVLSSRISWARTYLKKAGLITSPKRGYFQITELGKIALAGNKTIDNAYLSQFKSFQDFTKRSNKETAKTNSMPLTPAVENVQTPREIMDTAFNDINEQLADDLMTNIMDQDPTFFERLVIDLLEKMGYGGEIAHAGEVTGQTGDEGIDGIIREDALGFDKIYVQAKRWKADHAVGEPDIQQFAGALMGKGATKGLFITTSHFSRKAINYVEKHMSAKIVLIDGETLTRLMIQYNIGVSTIHSYDIKRVDSDYFDNNDQLIIQNMKGEAAIRSYMAAIIKMKGKKELLMKLMTAIVTVSVIFSVVPVMNIQAISSKNIHKTSIGSEGNFNLFKITGGYERVEWDQNLYVEQYSNSFKLISSRKIDVNTILPSGCTKKAMVFGTVYEGAHYNFICTGRNNPSQSKDLITLRVSKFDKSWHFLGACEMNDQCGVEIYEAFDFAACTMKELGNTLYVSTGRTGFGINDVHHQGKLNVLINIPDMAYIGSASDFMHSFDQYLTVCNGKMYQMELSEGNRCVYGQLLGYK